MIAKDRTVFHVLSFSCVHIGIANLSAVGTQRDVPLSCCQLIQFIDELFTVQPSGQWHKNFNGFFDL